MMEQLAPSFDQLSRGVNVILSVTAKQRHESLKIAKHAESLRKENVSLQDENVSLQDAVKSQKRSWQESEQERASLAINLKLARAELVAEEQRRRDVDLKRRDTDAKCRALENQVSLIRELVLSDKHSRSLLSDHRLQGIDIWQQPRAEDERLCDMSEAADQSIDPNNSDLEQTDYDGSMLRSGCKWRRSILQETYHDDGESDEDAASPPCKKVSTGRRSIPHSNTPTAKVVHSTGDFSPPSTEHVLSSPRRNRAAQSGKRPPSRKFRTASAQSDDGSSDAATSSDGAVSVLRALHRPEPSAPPYDELFPDEDDPEVHNLPVRSSLKRQASCASIQTLVESRPHDFVKKSVMSREPCKACLQTIKFASAVLKCKDCRAVCHEHCRDTCPIPCVPVAQTPQAKQAVKDGSLESFAPRRPPYVPSLVIHCAKEVEKRGMGEVGIYRIPGKDKSCKELKVKLLKGSKNSSGLVMTEDIHTVACTLKLFLRELRESVIPAAYFESFIDAAEVDTGRDRECMMQFAVRGLPIANQHTLAYLTLHLLRISEQSVVNRMTCSNLSTVFAPTIIASPGEQTASTMLADVNRQHSIIDALFSLDPQFWSDILTETDGGSGSPVSTPACPSPMQFSNQRGSPLSSPTSSPRSHQAQLRTPVHLRTSKPSVASPITPEMKQAPDIASVLGPITSSAQKNRAGSMATPRRRKRQGGFFSNVKGSAV